MHEHSGTHQKVTYQNGTNRVKLSDMTVTDSAGQGMKEALQEPVQILREFLKKLHAGYDEEEISKGWTLLASALDRICFFIFIISYLIITSFIFISNPDYS